MKTNLVIHDDNVNTFENIILSLMEVCNHDALQAEQCAMLVHYRGETNVESGDFDEILNMKEMLEEKGITASIK